MQLGIKSRAVLKPHVQAIMKKYKTVDVAAQEAEIKTKTKWAVLFGAPCTILIKF